MRSRNACTRRDFPIPALARDQHRLAPPLGHLREAILEEPELLVAAHQRCQAGRPRPRRGGSACRSAGAPGAACTSPAPLSARGPRSSVTKIPETRRSGRGGEHHRVGLGLALDARGQFVVSPIASVSRLAPPPISPDHDRARCGGRRAPQSSIPCRVVSASFPAATASTIAEPGAHRTLGVVLVGTRPAEVDEEPVAQVLRDMALVALDHAGADLLVAAHDLAPVLGVEASSQRASSPRGRRRAP